MDVSTEYSRWTLGLPSSLGSHTSARAASTWGTLVNHEDTENWSFQAISDFLRALCKQLPGSEVKGLKDQNHRLVKL